MTTAPAPTTRRPDLLRTALRLDAAVTGANGAAYLLAAPWLSDVLGVPSGALLGLGGFLLAYAVAVAAVAARRPAPVPAVEAVVAANALWAAASVAAVVAGAFDLTALGTAWVLLQAAVVAAFALVQIAGLRRR
ncbi:hypothetical protein [Blastococcus sp. TF02A-30]|uniref:hypothetical protein n=1 Tax=Blastococcus sp. TF02A-30 TaxID=2250580 RepID=UPI000DE8988C|nr:hypothetical protein [Blastococcus sp. TF02A-30]RBY92566.1 hypothetical protein DQ241_00250 [Blastococcus sp. TF02A-30]